MDDHAVTRGYVLFLVAVVAALSGALGVTIGARFVERRLVRAAPLANPAPTGPPGSPNGFRAVADRVGPTVVTIKASSTIASLPFDPEEGDDELGALGGLVPFGSGKGRGGRALFLALGSGIIVAKTGLILTNHHVVEHATRIRVGLAGTDHGDLPAVVLARSPRTDLAVLKITSPVLLPTVEWADSSAVAVGDWAVAIGSPFLLSRTLTVGVVSAIRRDAAEILGAGLDGDLIQTDAAINPGNSGGPLCTADGKVMGVNTAIFTRSGGSVGIGFAIPSNVARRVVERLERPELAE